MKKTLSLLLTLTMLLSLVPAMGTVVSAAEPEPVTLLVDSTAANDVASRTDENATYRTLQGAIDKAEDGDTIQLNTDVSLTDNVTVNKKLTWDLNGEKISVPWQKTINLGSGSDLTITGNGTINTRLQMFTMTGGKLTIENGTYTKDSEASEGGLINCKGGGTVLIKDGTFQISVTSNTENYAGFLLYSSGENSNITVEDGTFTLAPTTNFKPLFFGTDTVGEIYIKGGTWTGENYTYAVAAMRSIVITGGTFSACNGKDYLGTDINLANYLPKGYSLEEDGGKYTVMPKKNFQIGNTFYPTLYDAVADAKVNDTITVYANATDSDLVKIEKELTLDLNGKTLTLYSDKTSRVIDVLNGGKLTICDRSEEHTGKMTTTTLPRLISVNGGELVINSGTFEAQNTSYLSYVNVIFCEAGSVTLNDGTYSIPSGYGTSTNPSWYSSVIAATNTSSDKESTVTINGGTYNGTEKEYFRAKVITSFKNGEAKFGTIKVKGGTFNGTFDISSADNLAHVVVTGGRFDHLNLIQDSYVSTLHDIIDKSSYYILTENGTKTYYAVTPCGDSTSTITVPVSGDKNTVKVQATISGSNATIKNVTSEEITKVGTGDNVIIDLSGLKKSVTGVTIPKTTMENVAASEAKGLEVKLPNGTIAVFDKTTLAAVASQAKGANIQLVVDRDSKAEQSMTKAQKETVSEMNKPVVLDAYFTSNGQRISDFKGGEADITASYPTTSPVRVWYVADDGEKELVPSTYDGKVATFTVTHFCHYVVEMLDGTSYNTCPQDETCVYAKFSDANPKEWYHSGVHFCVENGYMNGVDNGLFAPNGTLSRAMIVTMLWRIEGSPVVNYAMSFKDVADDFWYTEAIRWAQSTGVVLGYDESTFGPEDDVTREQLAAILWRSAKYKGYDVSVGEDTNILSYDDAIGGISEYAISAMQWACGADIINGIGNKLEARGFATRAQAVCMIQRFCVNVAK